MGMRSRIRDALEVWRAFWGGVREGWREAVLPSRPARQLRPPPRYQIPRNGNGTWWIKSKKKAEWNLAGRGFVGGFTRPPEAIEAVERLKKRYGEVPDDLEWGYMKD